jgi:hypothetical protein
MDVTRYLLKFLIPRDQRRLLNTTQLLADMKKHVLFWKLTKHQSRIFYTQPSFRSQLETLVHDPSLQLSIRLDRHVDVADVSCLGNVHTLWLEASMESLM